MNNKFDKLLKKTERSYNRKYCNSLEKIQTSNPKDFWNIINKFDPQKGKLPNCVKLDDSTITSDSDKVFRNGKMTLKDCITKSTLAK